MVVPKDLSTNSIPGRWTRLLPLIGVVFVALVIANNLIIPSSPSSAAAGSTVIDFYSGHRMAVEIGAWLVLISLFVGLFFYALLCRYLSAGEGNGFLAVVAFSGAVVFAIGGGINAGLQYALADGSHHLDPATAQGLNVLFNDISQFLMGPGIGVLLFAGGLVIVRGRRLPVWLGWFGIVFAVVSLTPIGFIAFIAVGIWTLIASVVTYLRTGRPKGAVATGSPQPA